MIEFNSNVGRISVSVNGDRDSSFIQDRMNGGELGDTFGLCSRRYVDKIVTQLVKRIDELEKKISSMQKTTTK